MFLDATSTAWQSLGGRETLYGIVYYCRNISIKFSAFRVSASDSYHPTDSSALYNRGWHVLDVPRKPSGTHIQHAVVVYNNFSGALRCLSFRISVEPWSLVVWRKGVACFCRWVTSWLRWSSSPIEWWGIYVEFGCCSSITIIVPSNVTTCLCSFATPKRKLFERHFYHSTLRAKEAGGGGEGP